MLHLCADPKIIVDSLIDGSLEHCKEHGFQNSSLDYTKESKFMTKMKKYISS